MDGAIRLKGEGVAADSLRAAPVEYGGVSSEPLVGARELHGVRVALFGLEGGAIDIEIRPANSSVAGLL